MESPSQGEPTALGVVVHPARDIAAPLGELRGWAARRGREIVQIPVPGSTRQVAPLADARTCALIVSIGGDGTMLAAIRAAMAADRRPVLGVAAGSLGVLTRTAPGTLAIALDRFLEGHWRALELPALVVEREGTAEPLLALNDLVVVRDGIGQIVITVEIDGVLAGRIAGDGAIVATALGSSAYSLAAGGPLLGPGIDGYVLTPLATHGGELPPIVVGARSQLEFAVRLRYGGARLEVDGQIAGDAPERLVITRRAAVGRMVAFEDAAPVLSVLRSRGVVNDSPRVLAEDARDRELGI